MNWIDRHATHSFVSLGKIKRAKVKQSQHSFIYRLVLGQYLYFSKKTLQIRFAYHCQAPGHDLDQPSLLHCQPVGEVDLEQPGWVWCEMAWLSDKLIYFIVGLDVNIDVGQRLRRRLYLCSLLFSGLTLQLDLKKQETRRKTIGGILCSNWALDTLKHAIESCYYLYPCVNQKIQTCPDQ